MFLALQQPKFYLLRQLRQPEYKTVPRLYFGTIYTLAPYSYSYSGSIVRSLK